MSHFSIHLSEPLSDSEAKRVAQLTAPALGGSPEKLQLLLSRQAGSRIARASNQNQANTVANILRSAGVKVEVLENAAENEAQVPPAVVPPVLNAPTDPFAAPSIPALNVQESDPFAAPKSEPFVAPRSDPFAAPEPFVAPKSDPFAAPKSDPFAAPRANSDPFAAPRANSENSPNPFAAPGTAIVLDRKEVAQSDLPAQARKARDRTIPRTSVRRSIFLALLLPIIFVSLLTLVFQVYGLNISLERSLQVRAITVVSALKESLQTDLSLLPRKNEINATSVGSLMQKGSSILDNTPDSVLFAAQSGTLGSPAIISRLNITNEALFEQIKDTRANFLNPTGFTNVAFNGEVYLVAYGRVQYRDDLAPVGDLYIGFRRSQILQEAFSQILPTLIALAIVLLLAGFLTNALATRVTRPIISATDQANRIALGDLDRSVTVESNDEIGDMLGSLERMRVSLKSMVARMRRNT